jgi:hypothetical protein
MKINVVDNLPHVTATIRHGSSEAIFNMVLLDTGSAGSVFSVDVLREAGIEPPPEALIRRIVGIGGEEFVVDIPVDNLIVGDLQANSFTIEAGNLDYGFHFEAIIGFDFLEQARAVIDLAAMEIRKDG